MELDLIITNKGLFHGRQSTSRSAHLSVGATKRAFAPGDLLSHLYDAVIVLDVSLLVTAMNPAAEAPYGWSAAEALGRPVRELLQSDTPDVNVASRLQQLQALGTWRGWSTIIAVIALAMPGDRERCIAAGADGYMTKPIALRNLHKMIAARLGQGA